MELENSIEMGQGFILSRRNNYETLGKINFEIKN